MSLASFAKLPNFSLRFDRGRASLALQSPCALLSDAPGADSAAFSSGIIESLVLDLGPQRGGVRIAGGWTGLRTQRTEVSRGTLTLHPSAMVQAGLEAWSFDGVEGDAFRISFREGEAVFAFDAVARWRGQDLAVSLRNVRATERRTPTAWSELMGALERRFGAALDEGTGEVIFHRPLRTMLKSTFLRWGMRIPSLDGSILSPPTLITKHAGEQAIRIDLQRESVRAVDMSALVPTAPITVALVRGELARARQALEAARPRLDARLADELEAAIAIESDAGESKMMLGASLMSHLQALEGAIRAVCEPHFDRPLKDISLGQVLMRLFQTSRRFNVEIQPQLVLLQKTLLNIEGLGRQLDPELDLWSTARPFLETWMQRQLGWNGLVERLKQEAPRYAQLLPELPRLVHQALRRSRQPDLVVLAMLEEQRRTHRLIRGLIYTAIGFGAGVLVMGLGTRWWQG